MMLKYRGIEFCIWGLNDAAFRCLNRAPFSWRPVATCCPERLHHLSYEPFNDRALKRRPNGDGARWDVIDRRRGLLCCATLTMAQHGKGIIRIDPSPSDGGFTRLCGQLSGFPLAKCSGDVFQTTVHKARV